MIQLIREATLTYDFIYEKTFKQKIHLFNWQRTKQIITFFLKEICSLFFKEFFISLIVKFIAQHCFWYLLIFFLTISKFCSNTTYFIPDKLCVLLFFLTSLSVGLLILVIFNHWFFCIIMNFCFLSYLFPHWLFFSSAYFWFNIFIFFSCFLSPHWSHLFEAFFFYCRYILLPNPLTDCFLRSHRIDLLSLFSLMRLEELSDCGLSW